MTLSNIKAEILKSSWAKPALYCLAVGGVLLYSTFVTNYKPIASKNQYVNRPLPEDFIQPDLLALHALLSIGCYALFLIALNRKSKDLGAYFISTICLLLAPSNVVTLPIGCYLLIASIQWGFRYFAIFYSLVISLTFAHLAPLPKQVPALISGDETSIQEKIIILTTLIAAGILFKKWSEYRLQTETKANENRELLYSRTNSKRSDDRLFLAREVHDTISHRLSLISIYSGVLEYCQDLTEAQRSQQLSLVEMETKKALEEIDMLLSTLEQSDTACLTASTLQELINRGQSSGLEVEAVIAAGNTEALENIPSQIGQSAYSFVREAITNALKHAADKKILLTIELNEKELCLTTTNESDAPIDNRGKGLLGLQERAEAAGGRFEVTTSPFTASMRLPLPPEGV
ncbi:sensor histidine kinase [Corynebacterium sp. H130]|uniref:sensor histidine kinase n=1 Tax=Corynebacterium sp. H130 TaxID=3133444 RepID=UPI0030B5965A